MRTSKLLLAVAAPLFCFFSSSAAHAQEGANMWTETFKSQGLYQAHSNNCSGSETFFPLYSGASIGFCMENDERSAAIFSDAIADCAHDGKRLPEPLEWKVACQAGTLNDMTGAWEWVENTPRYYKNASYKSYFAMVAGYSSCIDITAAVVMSESSTGYSEQSIAYRCVH
jgi:hypothetical protein